MLDVQIAAHLFKAIDDSLQTTLASGTAMVMAGLGASFGTMWMLQFTIKSIYWLFQGMDTIFQDVIFSVLRMAVIVAFAFNVTWYIQTIVPIVTGLPTWMGGVLSGHEGTQTNQVDILIASYVDSLDKLVSMMKFGWSEDWSVMFYAILVIVFYLMGGIPFLSVCVGTIIVLKAATTIILVVGPIFIAFALFDQTKHWFMGWVAVIGGFMLTQVLFSVVVGIELAYINAFIAKNGVIETTLLSAFEILLVFGAFTLLATELPNYAASIMGGTPSGGVGSVAGLLGRTTGLGAATRMAGGIFNRFKGRNHIR
ncbi:type IV secretion system protein [Pseudomonas chlororaphis]|uniref:type IV secretion system protein n=1 Tax=Pseudomonas chlororaphis TaxID=587753 RepID=UPI002D784435|nr:type IV secretion system protein [Pseudomonas chlororaphis]